MKYRRSYKGEILVIFAVILSILVMVGSQNSSSSMDRYERLKETRESYILKEEPKTAGDMGVYGGYNPSETEAERQSRLQNAADFYNEKLEEEQESIRKRQEQEHSQKEAFMVSVLLGGIILVLVMVIRLSALVSEPPAFVVSDKSVSLKTNVLKEVQHIPLADIDRIRYEITRERFTDSEGNASYRSQRILYFDGEKNRTLGFIDLNILEGAHFNTIYQEISRKAPHIKWVFPE